MKNIIISLLNEKDREGVTYGALTELLDRLGWQVDHQATDVYDTLNFIKGFSNSIHPITFTFFGHGGLQGITDNGQIRIFYTDLLDAINVVANNRPVIVNFIANCKSISCLNYLPSPCNLEEIWYSVTDIHSLVKSIMASVDGFDDFHDNLDDEERLLYERWLP